VNYQSEIERKIQLEDVRSGILTVVKRKNLLTLISPSRLIFFGAPEPLEPMFCPVISVPMTLGIINNLL
jgi:hypothetical protein